MAKVYNANEVTLDIAGIRAAEIGGWADGEFIRGPEMDSDAIVDVVGTDGEVTISKSNDRRATFTIRVMQTSDLNDVLSALYNLTLSSPGIAGVGPFHMRDRQGRTKHQAPSCWIAKPPDGSWDRTAGVREWKIRVDQLDRFDGGNNRTA